MAQTYVFPAQAVPTRRIHRAKRHLGNKMQEIALRSPRDMAAFETLADLVLRRLNAADAALKPQ